MEEMGATGSFVERMKVGWMVQKNEIEVCLVSNAC